MGFVIDLFVLGDRSILALVSIVNPFVPGARHPRQWVPFTVGRSSSLPPSLSPTRMSTWPDPRDHPTLPELGVDLLPIEREFCD